MTKQERERLDLELLEILWGQSDAGREWVAAETIQRSYNGRHQLGRDGLSAIGVGRRLARLAREGRCEMEQGYMGMFLLRDRP